MNWMALLLVFFSFISQDASAAQAGKIIVPEANVYEFPQGQSRPLQTLKKDEILAVSNKPTEGFFKVRTKSGTVGWVSGNDMLVGPGAVVSPKVSATPAPATPEAPVASDAPPSAEVPPSDAPSEVPAEEKPVLAPKKEKREFSEGKRPSKKEKPPFDERFRLLAMYGIQTLNYGALLTQYSANSSDLNPGSGYTFEIQMGKSSTFMWAFRIEYFSYSGKPRNIGTVATPNYQTFTESSLPLMIGGMYSPLAYERFRLGIGLYLGMALGKLNNQTTVNQSAGAGPGTVTYTSTDPVAALNIQMDVGLSKHFALVFDGEYHYQKTFDQQATTYFGGKPAFQIDYSGIVLRGGLELRF